MEPKVFEPAFPVPDTHHPNGQVQFGTYGMSLRDYFAGQALMGILAAPGVQPDDSSRIGVAELAYEFADAMLAEREKCEPS